MGEKIKQVFFGILVIVTIFARWAWAKLRGKPFDNGMDM